MTDRITNIFLEIMRSRSLSAPGAFALQAGGGFQVDATAWAVLGLKALGQDAARLDAARSCLASRQLPDGRVCLSPEHPETIWPTALAILAWAQSPAHREALDRAAHFLLAASGSHSPRSADGIFGHDPSLRGWPWIAGTFSWVEPTAMAVMALKAAGHGGHARVREARRLLLDRQLPHGGWNYGNTTVFGHELFAFPENTGMALNALQGEVSAAEVQRSLDYLQAAVRQVRTPLALGWGLLGLAAWGQEPAGAWDWIGECLGRQEIYGPYDTASLSVLYLASRTPGGMTGIFRE